MAQTFNSPPGWPKPPEGWTPPPGWAPDPAWPAPPEGWQFWVDDPFAAAIAAENPQNPDLQATQTMGPQPTQAMPATPSQMPASAGQPALYAYAPSSGLEQPGASPYAPQSAPQQGGYSGGGYPGSPYTGPGGPTPKPRNTTLIVVVAVVAVLVLGGLVWGINSLFTTGSDEDSTAGGDPTPVTVSAEPTSDEPTDPETSEEPTTEEPTDDPTTDDGGGTVVDYVDLTGSEPALVYGSTGEPIVEVRLVEAVPDWESSEDTFICSEPENGQHLGLNLEFTILPAMANEEEPTYTFAGLELGALAGDTELETNALLGLFCVGSSESAPSEMQPGQTYTGWSVLDVPTDVTAATFGAFLDWTGESPVYRWVLADQ